MHEVLLPWSATAVRFWFLILTPPPIVHPQRHFQRRARLRALASVAAKSLASLAWDVFYQGARLGRGGEIKTGPSSELSPTTCNYPVHVEARYSVVRVSASDYCIEASLFPNAGHKIGACKCIFFMGGISENNVTVTPLRTAETLIFVRNKDRVSALVGYPGRSLAWFSNSLKVTNCFYDSVVRLIKYKGYKILMQKKRNQIKTKNDEALVKLEWKTGASYDLLHPWSPITGRREYRG